ncbi:MAG: tRNA pseudouridine(55) synthase TruB [Thermoanaerobacteraceae bacterium]|uniref:tRNA pseudouridine(55) synthase TruB n=1 Tax=Thermanaeromonas sp. C210 TaxID=2731925 RepID=UPI00155B6715|nr:tRNA pseudouridine(55) synthase TruB [Thermanaeromonas sp. C210]MBE3581594.1 tRNA pseudouridine(55) synthase TruB [Thermoanaerobacteraceae bacterium]GFN23839.1 tRNA pseudouridine synthase B [Thermanaeromonas sp. C210]
MEGFINLLKPPGPTSHDAVQRIRRLLGVKRVGHGGTLDPLAAGVLPVALGRATRLLEYVQEGSKAYRAEVIFGLETVTQDMAGEVINERPLEELDARELEAALSRFTGVQEQVPPMFSAVRHQGQRLYDLARRGEEVPRQPRRVVIYRLELLKLWPRGPYPRALLDVVCSKGTYVRTLCHDLGTYLGCGAAVYFLLRYRTGPFTIDGAWTLEEIEAALQEGRHDFLLPPAAGVHHLPAVVVKPEAVRVVLRGALLASDGCRNVPPGLQRGDLVRLHGEEGVLLAVARCMGKRSVEGFKPEKVFP